MTREKEIEYLDRINLLQSKLTIAVEFVVKVVTIPKVPYEDIETATEYIRERARECLKNLNGIKSND